MRKFVLGLDEGTTSLRAVLYDVCSNKIVEKCSANFAQFYPQNGWVEQDAEEIATKILRVSKNVLNRQHVQRGELLGIGITNQRETVVAWDKTTGKPICNAIVWQCRRTANMIKKLTPEMQSLIQNRTGLIPNAYFSASKMKWILQNVRQAKVLAKEGNLCLGTIDSFLAFRLTGNFVTDSTNASRTMLMNLKTLDWDDELLQTFSIPRSCLPKILPCDSDFGCANALLGAHVLSMIGDQQSSMIGQGALDEGDTKITYGTGGFVLTNISSLNIRPKKLLVTVARTLGGKTDYCIEGSIYSACSALNFLQKIGIFANVSQTSKMAEGLESNGGVYFVPAFTGLGAPYWNDDARAALVGMTYATTKNHIVRACLESMAYNTKAIMSELEKLGQPLAMMSVDGGGSRNDFLLQFLSDMLGREVTRAAQSEATVMGTIYVVMMKLGLATKAQIKKLCQSKEKFNPKMSKSEQAKLFANWQKAVKNL